jgi:hypothetical protein
MHLKEVKTDTISAPYLECLMKIPNYENPSIPTVDWGIFFNPISRPLRKKIAFWRFQGSRQKRDEVGLL